MKILTQERLKQCLHYDPCTGAFTWIIKKRGTRGIFSHAGRLRNDGYIGICIDYKSYMAHRLAWLYVYGKFPVEQIDHANGVRTDNRLENLRCATNAENQRNRCLQKNNTSGVNGITWYKPTNRWCAKIQIDCVTINLGYFKNKSDAVQARMSANKSHGFNQKHGMTNEHRSEGYDS